MLKLIRSFRASLPNGITWMLAEISKLLVQPEAYAGCSNRRRKIAVFDR